MFERYIGIDLHQAFFQACAVTVTGDRAWEDRFPRTDAGIAASLAWCNRRHRVKSAGLRKKLRSALDSSRLAGELAPF